MLRCRWRRRMHPLRRCPRSAGADCERPIERVMHIVSGYFPGPAQQGVGAEVPGPGRDQPHHRDRVSSGRWNPGMSWQRRGEFPELTAAVVAALEAAGYKVSVIM